MDKILSDSDKILGFNHPPDLEVIYVSSYVATQIPFTNYGFSSNMFGHICIRYTYMGKEYVTNIHPTTGRHKGSMVTVYKPSEYFFETTSPQMGISHRDIYGVRHYNVSQEQIAMIHNYLMHLSKNEGITFKFSGGLDLLLNIPRKLSLIDTLERGNCAVWTSKALKIAGIINSISTFPKKILINDFESDHTDSYLVHYKKQENNPNRIYGKDGNPFELVNPTITTSLLYGNLNKYADITIDFENNRITRNNDPLQPNSLRKWISGASTVVLPTFIVFKINKRYQLINKLIRYWPRK